MPLYADKYVLEPPRCTYDSASRVLYVPEAQGSLPQAGRDCTYAARVSASGVPHVPHAVALQVPTGGGGIGQGGLPFDVYWLKKAKTEIAVVSE